MSDVPSYEVFADDSSCSHIVIYGFFWLHSTLIETALKSPNDIKVKFGGSEHSEIHCRILFSGEARAKSSWAHLKGNQPYILCLEVAKAMNSLGVSSFASYTNKTDLAKRMKINFRNSDQPNKIFEVPLGDKQIQQFLYTGGAFFVHQLFGWGNYNIWIDKDKTKIEWFNGRKQAKNIHEIVKPADGDIGDYESMLEIADIFAYAAGRIISRAGGKVSCISR